MADVNSKNQVTPQNNAAVEQVSQPVAAPAMPKVELTVEPAPTPVPSTNPAAPVATTPAPSVGVAAAPGEDKNVFSELFGKDEVQKNAAMMGAVVSTKDQQKKSMLGGGAKLKKLKSLGKNGGKDAFKISRSKPGKMLLQISLAVLILTSAFFYSQNSADFTWFGTNSAQKVVLAEQQLGMIESEITVQKYLSAVLLLDQYSNLADEYLYNISQSESEYVSSNKKATAVEDAEALVPEMTLILERVQGYLSDDLEVEERTDARTLVDDLITELKSKSGEVDEATLLQDIQDLESTKKLLQGQDFRNVIAGMDLSEAGEDKVEEDFENVYYGYSDINTSVTSLINGIKDGRMLWSVYLAELEDLTKNVDPLFGTEFDGNLSLNSVRFGASGVIISGESYTDDTKNFTLISNLIDTYEDSDLFMNAADRSFEKSGDDESYTGNFQITMDLEGDEDLSN
jgi:hypothetical protein